MRPIDVCTPKPFQLEHSYFVDSQRNGRPARCLAASHEDRPRSEALRPRARSGERLFSRAVLARPKTSGHVHRQLGADRCEPGWGELRFTMGLSLRRPAGAPERRRFFLCEKPDTDRLWHPCRILFPARSGSRFIERRTLVQRPPRPVPREPRERRALLRSGMPSIGSRCAQRARAEARTSPRSLLRDTALT
jgi:hypothetical protein